MKAIILSLILIFVVFLAACSSSSSATTAPSTSKEISPQSMVTSTTPESISTTPSNNIRILVPTVKDEVDRIWTTLEQINFLDQYGYKPKFPSLPEMDSFVQKARANELSDSDYNAITISIEKIFNKADYTIAYTKVSDSLPIISQVFPVFTKYKSNWGFKIFPTYTIHLTMYGMGGSYDPQTGTIILLTTPDGTFVRGNSPTQTVIHEMVHLGIEKCIVQEYSLGQKTKERIVDLFCNYHFLSLVPDYRLQPNQDTSIDSFLTDDGAWNDLKSAINSFNTDK
jgi:hypothetical protein